MANKYYAVRRGKKTGIFTNWPDCQRQVKGYPGAQFKSFKTQTEANEWLTAEAAPTKKRAPQPQVTSTATIQMWTDGGTRNHGNKKGQHVLSSDPAAWAFCVIKNGKKYTASAGEFGSTNNRMEVMALVKALKFIGREGWQTEEIAATLDSKYVLDAINKQWLAGWKRRGWKTASGTPVANQELWQEIDTLLPLFPHLNLNWTKGHAKNAGNVLVDQLLNETMDQM